MSEWGIGKPVRRREDDRFIRGRGQYTDDINRPNQTHAVFVRSPHAHALIRSIDLEEANAAPGVVAVFTGKDVAEDGLAGLICGWTVHSKDGSEMKAGGHPILAAEKVRYVGDHVALVIAETKAQALAADVDRFMREEDAWFDDVLIADMISKAKRTGDVTRNPVRLDLMEFEQRNFWTAHFGGLYVMQGMDHPALISSGDKGALGKLPIKYVFDVKDRNQIAKFLEYNDLAEPIVKARGIDAAAILRQKMDFIVVDTAQDAGMDLAGATRRDIRALARRHARDLPEEFHGLAALLRWAEEGGKWPRITSDHPAYFYTLRSADHADRDLVNMLLSQLSPKDVRQLFICHKELFYQLYATWPESKKSYVADFLDREYQVDKAGVREALFGHDAEMAQPAPKRDGPWGVSEKKIAAVGPWGAVRGR